MDFPVWVQDCWFGMFLCYSHVHTHTHARIHTYQVASKLSALRQREGDVNSLHHQLQTITRTLGEARELLEAKQQVLDVGKFLSRCKVREELTELRLSILACIKAWLASCRLQYCFVRFVLCCEVHVNLGES